LQLNPNAKTLSKAITPKTLVSLLFLYIIQGSSGVWGLDMMPPQPQVSDAKALTLAKYILSLK
jgi:cytochrome c551/c552